MATNLAQIAKETTEQARQRIAQEKKEANERAREEELQLKQQMRDRANSSFQRVKKEILEAANQGKTSLRIELSAAPPTIPEYDYFIDSMSELFAAEGFSVEFEKKCYYAVLFPILPTTYATISWGDEVT